jgi:Glycosyltransferase
MSVVKVIISKQCINCSFDIVATQFYNWIKTRNKGIVLQKLGCNGDIEFIDINLWWTQCRFIDDTDLPKSIIRGDSPYQHVKDSEEKSSHLLITTSNYNAKLFSKLFKHIEVVPHPYDPQEINVVENVKEKKYDVITIGYNTADDHKGLRIARKVVKDLGLKYIEISNECNGEEWCYKFMSFSRTELYKLIAQSRFYLALSHTEGFGLPLLESMIAGTVPIFVKGHAFAEYAEGIPIPAYKTREDWFEYEYEDVIKAVKYALSLSKKEYNEMSLEIKNKARERFEPEKIFRLISSYFRSS